MCTIFVDIKSAHVPKTFILTIFLHMDLELYKYIYIYILFNRSAHSAVPGISVWRLGGMGSVRSGVSRRIGLLGWIGLFGWIGVFGWLAWLIWLSILLWNLIVWESFLFHLFLNFRIIFWWNWGPEAWISKVWGHFFDEIEVWRLTFSRKGVHGRF